MSPDKLILTKKEIRLDFWTIIYGNSGNTILFLPLNVGTFLKKIFFKKHWFEINDDDPT